METIELHGQSVTLEAADLIPELTIWFRQQERAIGTHDQWLWCVRLRDALDWRILQWDAREG